MDQIERAQIESALSDIGAIRAQMASSTRFRGYAPELLVAVAALCLLVLGAQALWSERLAASDLHYVVVWGAVLAVSQAVLAVEAVVRTRRLHGALGDPLLHSALRSHLPFAAAAVILAIGVCRFAPDAVWLVPAIWLWLIALTACASHAFLPRRIGWAAVWYGLTGTGVLVLAGGGGGLAGWMVGLPLAIGHLLVAWALRDGGESARGL